MGDLSDPQAYKGIYHLLPLGLRVQGKIEKLIDKHMRRLGQWSSCVSRQNLTLIFQRRIQGFAVFSLICESMGEVGEAKEVRRSPFLSYWIPPLPLTKVALPIQRQDSNQVFAGPDPRGGNHYDCRQPRSVLQRSPVASVPNM